MNKKTLVRYVNKQNHPDHELHASEFMGVRKEEKKVKRKPHNLMKSYKPGPVVEQPKIKVKNSCIIL